MGHQYRVGGRDRVDEKRMRQSGVCGGHTVHQARCSEPLEKWAVVDCSLQYWLSPGMVKKEAWVGEP